MRPDPIAEGRHGAVTGCTGYEIRLTGTLARRWWPWFEDYRVTTAPSGETVLSTQISDQRLLIGALVTLHELGYSLVCISAASLEEKREAEGALGPVRSPVNIDDDSDRQPDKREDVEVDDHARL